MAIGWISKPPCPASTASEDITAVFTSRGVQSAYTEANVLVPLDYLDKDSGTPSYKSVPVRIILRSKEIRML